MKRLSQSCTLIILFLSVGLVGLIGCDTAVDVQPAHQIDGLNAAPDALGAMSQGVQKTPIDGTIEFVGGGVPERIIITPGGVATFSISLSSPSSRVTW